MAKHIIQYTKYTKKTLKELYEINSNFFKDLKKVIVWQKYEYLKEFLKHEDYVEFIQYYNQNWYWNNLMFEIEYWPPLKIRYELEDIEVVLSKEDIQKLHEYLKKI